MQQSAKCLWGWHHKFKLQGELYMSGRLGFPTQLKKKEFLSYGFGGAIYVV